MTYRFTSAAGDLRPWKSISLQCHLGEDAPCKTEFVYWTPTFLGDDSLSSEQWERRACNDSLAGTLRFGNHKCRKTVCLKQKTRNKHKRPKCRFRYWHWQTVKTKSKGLRMQRVPGCALAAAWDGEGLPPVNALEPEVGLPALECTWPYHFKESFATLLGAR